MMIDDGGEVIGSGGAVWPRLALGMRPTRRVSGYRS
jgi:hypothetical protein